MFLFALIVSNKTFKFTYCNRFKLFTENTSGLALRLLRTDPSADCRQRVTLLNYF